MFSIKFCGAPYKVLLTGSVEHCVGREHFCFFKQTLERN